MEKEESDNGRNSSFLNTLLRDLIAKRKVGVNVWTSTNKMPKQSRSRKERRSKKNRKGRKRNTELDIFKKQGGLGDQRGGKEWCVLDRTPPPHCRQPWIISDYPLSAGALLKYWIDLLSYHCQSERTRDKEPERTGLEAASVRTNRKLSTRTLRNIKNPRKNRK